MTMQLTQSVRRAAQVNGNGIATQDGSRQQTWTAFAERVAKLAGGLHGLGLGPGDRVAILALNSDRYLEYFFAVVWAGGVFVPVNTRLAGPEIVYWLNDSECKILFVDRNFLASTAEVRDALETIEHLIYLGDDATPDGMTGYEDLLTGADAVPDAGRGDDDLAGIFYTGGTTGRSKGVMLSHTNLVSNALNVTPMVGLNQQASYLHAAPMFHLADGALSFAVTMCAGRHSFVPSFEPKAVLEAAARDRVTNMLLVPTMINMLVQHSGVEDYDLGSIKSILYGASPMPEAVIKRAMELMPDVRFTHGYGLTESAPGLSMLPPEFHVAEGPNAGRMGSIGRALYASEVRIHDEDDNEVPRGTIGEICARGPNIMLG